MSFHIIGDQDTILGFAFAGVAGTVADSAASAQAAVAALTGDAQTQVLIVTERVAVMVDEQLTAHRLTAQPPFVVEIPDIWGGEVERKGLEAMIQEAVGIRIVKD